MGRLIDADALLKEINGYVFTSDMTTTLAVSMACRWIENATTVDLSDVNEFEVVLKQDAIDAITELPRLILDHKGEFQPIEPPTKAMIDPDDAVAAIENLPLAKPGFDSVVKLDKAFDDGYKQGYLQAESDLSISQPHENDRLNNQVHLCNSCKYDFPDCPSKNDDIVFGNGVGDDNIVLAVNTCRPYSRGGR